MGHLVTWQLQCNPHGAALEDHLEVSSGPGYSSLGHDGYGSVDPHNIPISQVVLVTNLLSDVIQAAGHYI